MGMGTNILLFTFCLSFSYWMLLGYSPMFVSFVACFQNPENPIINSHGLPFAAGDAPASCLVGGITNNSLYVVVIGIFGVVVTVGLIAGSLTFPDPYKIFGLAAIFLFGFITFPVDLIFADTGYFTLPFELKAFSAGFFMLAYALMFLLFYRSGSSW